MTTFVRVTNQDIFNELKGFKEINYKQHQEIIAHQIKTNGKVKLNRWIATTALSLIILVMGLFVNLSV